MVVHGGWGCGRCRLCLSGDEQLCDVGRWAGIGRQGGFAEYVVVPASRHLVPLGDLDPVLSAPLADAALTPYHAVQLVRDRLYPGSTAVLVGAGGLGQYGVQLLRELTSATVLVVDTDADKRRQALDLGADRALHPDEVDGALLRSASAVVDLVGSDDTLALAGRVLAPRGAVVLVGLAGGELPASFLGLPPDAAVMTSWWGTRNELAEVVALAAAGRLTGQVHEVDLAGVNGAMADLRAGQVAGRVVLVP